MSIRNTFKSGDWLALCQRCGFEDYASKLRDEWTGLRVCKKCWEPRHPQDFVRAVEDTSAVPWTVPEADFDDEIAYLDDESVTLTTASSDKIQEYNTTLTANRIVYLSRTGASEGDRFTIKSSGDGNYTITIKDGDEFWYQDNFNQTNGSLLQDVTSDSGDSYYKNPGSTYDFVVQSGKLDTNATITSEITYKVASYYDRPGYIATSTLYINQASGLTSALRYGYTTLDTGWTGTAHYELKFINSTGRVELNSRGTTLDFYAGMTYTNADTITAVFTYDGGNITVNISSASSGSCTLSATNQTLYPLLGYMYFSSRSSGSTITGSWDSFKIEEMNNTLKSWNANVDSKAVVEFNGTNWILVDYQTL